MAGLLTFIADEYKKHWKAFVLLGVIACALQMIQSYALADYPTLTESIKALFSGDFNIRNIISILFNTVSFILSSMLLDTGYYIFILQGNLKNIFKFAPRMILVNVLFYICFGVYVVAFSILWKASISILYIIAMNIYFVDTILFLILWTIRLVLLSPFLFLSYILPSTSISIIKYDMSLMEGLKKACSIIYGYEYRSLFVHIIGMGILLILFTPINLFSQELAQMGLSLFIFIPYIIAIYLYNYFESREEKKYSTLFERAVERLFKNT